MDFPIRQPLSTDKVGPTAVVTKARWVDGSGNQMTVAGARARGIALQNFSASEVANVTGYPPSRLAIVNFGPAPMELGADVGNNKLVTTDASGKTIEATSVNHEQLGYVRTGGKAGDVVEGFVFCNEDTRVPAAAIASLTGAGSGTANGSLAAEGTLSTAGGNTYSDAAVNAILAKLEDNIAEVAAKQEVILVALRAQKIIAP